jgi:hypothetical protein
VNSENEKMIIPCNTRAHTWTYSDGSQGGFRPRGQLVLHGADLTANPAELLATKTWSARIFVGLSVGKRATWTLENVVAPCAHTRSPSAGRRIRPSCSSAASTRQIIMLRTSDRPSPQKWQEGILQLAEHLAGTLRQESVIVEFQEGGVSQGTYEVRP